MSELSSILILDSNRARATLIANHLQRQTGQQVQIVATTTEMAERMRTRPADAVVLCFDAPTRDALPMLADACGVFERPVAIFASSCPEGVPSYATHLGFSAFVVDGLQPERVAAILEAAAARFHDLQSVRKDLATTRRQLEERKLIDRAKGVLMKARQIEEAEAYALLRTTAMNRKQRLAEVAEALIAAAELLNCDAPAHKN